MATPQPLESEATVPRVQVISRVGQILRALSQEPAGRPLADVVAQTGLAKSTAYRLLLALQQEELVENVDGHFRIGRALVSPAASRHEELRRRLRPLMERLAVQVQETVDLGVLVGDQILFVEQVRWHRELSVGAIVGELYPASASACGKALLAASPNHVSSTRGGDDGGAPSRADDQVALARELDAVATESLAYDREGFHPGIAGVATFARMRDGDPVSMGIVVPSARFDSKLPALVEQLLAARAELDQIAATV